MPHQFSLFGFQKPSKKIPISAKRIEEAKALFQKGDNKGAEIKMREVREALESYLKRLK